MARIDEQLPAEAGRFVRAELPPLSGDNSARRQDAEVWAEVSPHSGAKPAQSADGTDGRITRGSAIRLGVAWAILFPLALVLEPVPPAGTSDPWWGIALSLGLLAALAATASGLVRLRSSGVTASLVASSLFTVGVFACPATAHHPFGLWWFGEFAAAVTLVAFSATAFMRRWA